MLKSNNALLYATSILVVLFLGLGYYIQQSAVQRNRLLLEQARITKLRETDKRKKQPIQLPILLYHYVEDVTDERDTIRKSLNVTPQTFESQILTLITEKYTPIVLDNLINFYETDAALPEKIVILTFDDGYRDFYTDVLPILQKYQIPAVLYVVSGFLDTTKNYLTKDQLRQIGQSGLVEIAAHSVTHPNFHYFDIPEIADEITKSKTDLETLIGIRVNHFAYPFGAYNPNIIQTVFQAGFLTAATVNKGTIQSYQDRYTLKRIRPGSLTGKAFLTLLQTP